MNSSKLPRVLVSIDAETWGPLGNIFWIGAIVYDQEFQEIQTFNKCINPEECLTDDVSQKSIVWVRRNVLNQLVCSYERSYDDLLELFGKFLDGLCETYEVHLLADCSVCIESRLLRDLAQKCGDSKFWFIHDVATALFYCGLHPTGTYSRKENESPSHHPIHDARQTARLFHMCGFWGRKCNREELVCLCDECVKSYEDTQTP